MSILEKMSGPSDLRGLEKEEIRQLCEELRSFLIENVSATGGHLAANLGVVELTVALLRSFDPPKDKIVFDVGHQSYVYKILTGRRDRFPTLRSYGGLCGFPRPSESEYDAFSTGHSSTSISAALGLAEGMRLRGEDGYAVAVIGDGALTGGLAFEGLNNAGRLGGKLIIILNDNEHSISKNVGALSEYLSELTSRPNYFRAKDVTKRILGHVPVLGEATIQFVRRIKRNIRHMLCSQTMFEELGFEYFGQVDGHDEQRIFDLLERAKTLDRPSVIHIKTIKGKGYAYAERKPELYHGVPKFDVACGTVEASHQTSFSSVFGEEICKLAKRDARVCAITAAMTDGVGLCPFASGFAERFYDVGIAEGHAVTFAAGLAAAGMRPYVAVYSSFLQRAYDELVHDVCLDEKRVVLCVDRAGLVGEDGDTHQGIFDVAMLSAMPGMTVYSPATLDQLRRVLGRTEQLTGPCAVRYPRGGERPCPFALEEENYSFFGERGAETLLVTYGRMSAACIGAAKKAKRCAVLSLLRVRPFDPAVLELVRASRRILFVEEGIKTGGAGEHFETFLREAGIEKPYRILAIEDRFVPQGSVEQLLALCGLSEEAILRAVEGENDEKGET